MLLTAAIIIGVTWYSGAKFYQNKSTEKTEPKNFTLKDNTLPKAGMLKVKEQTDAKKIHQYFVLSIGMLGLMLGSVIGYPLLGLISIIGVTYLSMPFISNGYQELFQEHQIGARTLDAIVVTTLLLLKSFFVANLFYIFFLYH
ncbi:MAG: hypothetical protein HC877_07200 [Thioploca sp.]|nr:hypothetical protein [Thioploca sp.]